MRLCLKLGMFGIFLAILLTSVAAVAQNEAILHRFHLSDGAFPQGGPIADSEQNVYGTTIGGGLGNCVYNAYPGCGVVFEVSRGAGGWTEKVLHSFQGPDGAFPMAGLVSDQSGNLYGATSQGGLGGCRSYGCGAIFELVAPAEPGGEWTFSLLYSFTGKSDGAQPEGALIFDNSGNLYGTASQGGTGSGTVFELSPPANGGSWTETTLHQFAQLPGDGQIPMAGLVFDKAGNLYGTTSQGGDGVGTVFKLEPPAAPGGDWTERMLYAFKQNTGDGESPYSTLIIGQGALLGTTARGGQYSQGTVFQLTALFGEALETILYSFQGSQNDIIAQPNGTLAVDNAMNLFGSGQGSSFGGVFQLSPPGSQGGAWSEQVLYSFAGGNDGAYPDGGILLKDGWLFGTTSQGGGSPLCAGNVIGCGTVFAIRK